jgi:hypothetical protein
MTVRELIEKLQEIVAMSPAREDCDVILHFENLDRDWEMDLMEVVNGDTSIFLRS